MMGERRVDQGALFYEFSLERHVPADHLLRAIDRFVSYEGECAGSLETNQSVQLSHPGVQLSYLTPRHWLAPSRAIDLAICQTRAAPASRPRLRRPATI